MRRSQLWGHYDAHEIFPGARLATSGRFPPDIRLYNIERIEVLRGPQGTLYGGDSVGGTLRVIPRQADLSELSAYFVQPRSVGLMVRCDF